MSESTTNRAANTTPAVSVILPIMNVEKYLDQCLTSVCNQTLKDLQIICVDDGSTDSSGAIIDRFAAADPRIVAIHKPNGGYGKAVNVGLEEATGVYVGIVEPDDYLDERMFQTLYDEAQRTGCPDVVKGAYWRVIDAGLPSEQIVPCNYLHTVAVYGEPFTLDEDAEYLYHHPSVWSAIYLRSWLNETGIRMHEIPGAGWADNPWLIETLSQARSIVAVDEPLYYYREFNLGSSSVVKDPSIIYERWLDMDEFIRAARITAPKILEGHYNRGCAYIEMLNQGFDINELATARGLGKMVHRIDWTTVKDSEKIPQNYKDALRQHEGPIARGMYFVKKKLGR